MHYSPLLLPLLPFLTFAADIQVAVGNGGNVFSPATVKANAGDTVSFVFNGDTHNVVQSSFDAPCSPMQNGFAVGFQSSATTFTINVTNTDPIWYYCSYENHCNVGMVGVINPPADKTQKQFASAAKSATINQPAGNDPVNGQLSNGAPSSAAPSGSQPSASSGQGGTATVTAAMPAQTSSMSSTNAGAAGPTGAPVVAMAAVVGAVAAML